MDTLEARKELEIQNDITSDKLLGILLLKPGNSRFRVRNLETRLRALVRQNPDFRTFSYLVPSRDPLRPNLLPKEQIGFDNLMHQLHETHVLTYNGAEKRCAVILDKSRRVQEKRLKQVYGENFFINLKPLAELVWAARDYNETKKYDE